MANYDATGNWMNQDLVPQNQSFGGINQGELGAMSPLGSEFQSPSIGQGIDWGGWAKGFGNVAGGVGGLAQAWQGMQGLKLAKKQLATQNEQWQKNYDAQRGDIAYDRANRASARARQSGPSKIS